MSDIKLFRYNDTGVQELEGKPSALEKQLVEAVWPFVQSAAFEKWLNDFTRQHTSQDKVRKN